VPSVFGFVREHEPVEPERLAAELLALPPGAEHRAKVEELVASDPRLTWDPHGMLRVEDPASLSLEEAPFVVFDVETTGSSAKNNGALTEIGAVKIVGGVVVDQFSTLVNPVRPIEPFVVRLTGITNRMVSDAPLADEVMGPFERFVEGCVLVGHNVSFDCSFIGAAREAAGLAPLPNLVLDTLKLARALVPGLKRYRLASLATHFGVRSMPNHRALSDAAATGEIFVRLLKLLRAAGVGSVGEAAALRGRGRRIKPQKGHLADGVPHTPGVYYFVDKDGTVLYVGKAKDLKARVRTYFNGGDGRRKVGRLVEEVAEVRVTETESELMALVLEAREIRRLLPRYNSAGRWDKATWFIRLDGNEPYPVPVRVAGGDPEDGVVFLGPYRSAGILDTCIEALGRIFPLRRCAGESPPCFYGQMGRCAPCLGMDPDEYRTGVLDEIASLMRGEGGEEYLMALVRERERLAGELEFEAAARLRDLISGIERIRLTRAVVDAEGTHALVAPSTEPGIVEVFVIAAGRLVAHGGFEAEDAAGLALFAAEALASETAGPPLGEGPDDARVVAAYLRRRSTTLEALRLESVEDLLQAVGRVAGDESGTNVASLA
jgi:DNA polymerase-3 subunit epsilon